MIASSKHFFKASLLAAAAAMLLPGCSMSGTTASSAQMASASTNPGTGHLVIVGGGLRRENDQIYGRIVELSAEGGALIVPTASGVPHESGPDYAQDFRNRGMEAKVVDITMDNPEEAANPAKADMIRNAGMLFFTGGDQARIIAAFRPDSGDTIGYDACWEVLRKGGVIAGSSAGAAMMSDPCLRWGNSAEALLIGESQAPDRGVGIARGMGFFPYGLTGQHFMSRGRMGRLIVALEETGTQRGYGVDDNNAFHVNLETGRIETLGDWGVLLLDLSNATRDGIARQNVRVSLLNDGDAIDGNTGTITPAGKPWTTRVTGDPGPAPAANAWDDYVIPHALTWLALAPGNRVVLDDDHLRLVFTKDERTSIHNTTSGSTIAPEIEDHPLKRLTLANVRLDIEPKESAEAAREALLRETAEAQ